MAEIKASANFSSVVQEISKVTEAYTKYNTKAGKAVSANINLVNSFKSLNTVLNQTANLIANAGKPLRDYTKNFNASTSATEASSSANRTHKKTIEEEIKANEDSISKGKRKQGQLKALKLALGGTNKGLIKSVELDKALKNSSKGLGDATKNLTGTFKELKDNVGTLGTTSGQVFSRFKKDFQAIAIAILDVKEKSGNLFPVLDGNNRLIDNLALRARLAGIKVSELGVKTGKTAVDIKASALAVRILNSNFKDFTSTAGKTKASILQTVGAIKKLNLDFDKINPVTAKVRTSFQKTALKLKIIRKEMNQLAEDARNGNSALNRFGQAPIAKRLGKVSKSIDQTSKSVTRLTLSVQTFVRLGAFQIMSRGISTLTQGLRQGSEEAIDFEKKISAIRTISTENQLSFNQWADGIREVSDSFNIPLLEATESVYTSISNQVVKGAEAFEFLRVNANLAITAQGSISDAISATSSIIKSYNLDISDANEISAKLFKTAELGRVPLASIGETIGTVTVIASRAGVSFDEVSASLATMTVQGIKPVKAITFLRNIILKILKPTEAMKKAVESMGFASAETAVRTLGLGKFLEELRKTTKGTASELAQLLGSVRAMQAGFALSGTSLEQYEENLRKIGNATKDFDERIKIAKESVGFNFQKELNAGASAMTNLGRSINETALKVIKSFGGLKNIIEQVITLIAGGLVAGALLLARKAFIAVSTSLTATTARMATLGVVTETTNIKMFKLGLTVRKLGIISKTAFRAFAPFLAIEAGFAISDALINSAKATAKAQIEGERAVETALNNSLKNRERALKRFVDNSKKIRDKGVTDSIIANNKRVKTLKDSLNEGSKAFDDFAKNAIKSSKSALSVIKEQETALNKTLKSTVSILDEIKKGRAKLDDSIFGKGFSNLDKIPSLQKELDKALIENSAENLQKSFFALKTSIESAIAGSEDASFISAMQERLRLLFDTVEKRTKKINEDAIKNQIAIVAKRKELEDRLRRTTEAKDLVSRISPTQILKEDTALGVTISGDAILDNLKQALDIAPLLQKPEIEKKITKFNELFTRRLLQLSNEEFDKSRDESVDKINKLVEDIFKRSGKEIKTVGLANIVKTEIDNLLGAGRVGFNAVGEEINQNANISITINKKNLAVLRKIRQQLVAGASITTGDLKTLREIVKTQKKLSSDPRTLSVLGFKFKEFNKALDNLRNTSFQSGQFGLLGTLTTASALTKKLDELLKKQEKITGESKRTVVSRKEKLALSTKNVEQASNELKILEKTNQKQKDISKTIAERIEKVDGVSDGKKNNKVATAVDALEKNVKEKGKDQVKKANTEGFLESLPEIFNPFVEFIKKASIKAFKNLPTGVGDSKGAGGSEGVSDPIFSKKLSTDLLPSLEKASKDELERNKNNLPAIQRIKVEIADTEKNIKTQELLGLDTTVQKEILKTLKKELKVKVVTKRQVKVNSFLKEGVELSGKIDQVGKTATSLGEVITGTSKQIDLTGFKVLNLGENFNRATTAVQGFANALLQGRKKGLTAKQRFNAVLQGAVTGASAGASIGGPFAGVTALAGGLIGATTAIIQTRQRGGLIHRAAGGDVPSKGTDTVPAMLTAGEFVMNRGSTDKFYSQLKAMNSTNYRADGGRVSNQSVTVGDINVSPASNSSGSGIDVGQLGNQIRRDIRNGKLGSFS